MEMITIVEPSVVAVDVGIDDAEVVIRSWFCTTGIPAKADKVMKDYKLGGNYDYGTNKSVSFDDLPEMGEGESYEDYAERIASDVNDMLGFEFDNRLCLSAY